MKSYMFIEFKANTLRSRHLNNDMKHLRSQPEDNLSSHILSMSRQTIICRDMIG